jgi:hypothetical protein
MVDPVYRRLQGETDEEYEERIAKLLPPDFAGKTEGIDRKALRKARKARDKDKK